jgi:ribonuclease D
MNDAPPKIIDSQTGLADLIDRLATDPRVAVDMEADSLHHYYEKVCLIQVARSADAGTQSPRGLEIFIVDTLAGLDLSGFFAALAKPVLVMHGADYDLRMLYREFTFTPGRIFDTQIGAQLLGVRQFGLAALAEQFLGVSLAKGNQKADWSQRPLPEKLLAYAAEDVRHMFVLADSISERLAASGRGDWHRQTCEAFILAQARGPDAARRNDPDLCWRVKGWQDLSPRELAMLRELWQWREEEAKAADRPPFKVLGNASLIDLARYAVAAEYAGLDAGPRLPRDFHGSRRARLEEAVLRGRQAEPAGLPRTFGARRSTTRRYSPKLMERLAAARNGCADDLGIDPTVLATRAELTALAQAPPPDLAAMRTQGVLLPWQVDVLGEKALAALHKR